MWKDKRIAVFGAGKSGVACAIFLHNQGAKVSLVDSQKEYMLRHPDLDRLRQMGIELKLGESPATFSIWPDLAVVSPGIPLDGVDLEPMRRGRIKIIGEIELAYLATQGKIIGVTGSNGKTTTTTLLGQMLRSQWPNTFVGGNLGQPFIEAAGALRPDEWAVLELSSFQMESTEAFRPKIGVLLNFSPDHLDRHHTYESYLQAKWAMVKNQSREDILVYNQDDSLVVDTLPKDYLGKVCPFSRKTRLLEGVYVDESGTISVAWQNALHKILPVKEIRLFGVHNLENVLAAVAAAYLAGVDQEIMRQVIREFQGVAHRLELVVRRNGVTFINDSKGTNVDATIKALEAFEEPILLIAGGLGKGASYDGLATIIHQKVKHLILIGQDAPLIQAAVLAQGDFSIVHVKDMEAAVSAAKALSQEGDVVLLSPACASYDMFQNYGQRGDMFKEWVLK